MPSPLTHLLIGHHLAGLLRLLGFPRLAFRLHDRTLPAYRSHLWDAERWPAPPRRRWYAWIWPDAP